MKTMYKLCTLYTSCDNITHRVSSRGHMSTIRICEPIYTIKNLYNDVIILQDFFLREKYVVVFYLV